MGRVLKWLMWSVLLLVGAVAAWLWDPLPANPSPEVLAATAQNYNVEIIRDNYGVPHIYGRTDADAAFGLGYAHAEDDFETIQEVIALTRGVMARYKGASGATTDYLVEFLNVWDSVDAQYPDAVSDAARAVAEGYAAGLNLYASENPDAAWQGLFPVTAEDIFAGNTFREPFFYGLERELRDLFGEQRHTPQSLDPAEESTTASLLRMAEQTSGSNAIAVSADRSGEGVTRLVINSHQPMEGPVAWWEAHTVSEEGLDFQGATFPGAPILLHGFNRHLGWANTVNNPDLIDVYRLTPNPANKGQYKLDNAWEDFEVETAKIRIKLFGPFAFTARRKVYTSAHGPVIKAKHGTYAVRYAAMNDIRWLTQRLAMVKATSWDQFNAAMAMQTLSSINYIYADKDDTVALIHNGMFPDRVEGWQWRDDLPGDRSDLIWHTYKPYEAVPILRNPASGLIYNANNQVFNSTDGADNLTPDLFSDTMGLQTNETNRSLRLSELTDGTAPIDRDRLLAIKFDTAYAAGSEADEVVRAVLAADWRDEPDLQPALEHLRAWDRGTQMANRHAALGVLTTIYEITEKFTGVPAPEPAQAFRQAVDYLMTHHGRIDPAWGEVSRLVRGDMSWPVSGGPDTLRAIYSAVGDDGQLRAVNGDTWMALVEWHEDGRQTAQLIHQYGNATLDETSPHYADQAPLFAGEQWRDALFDRADIEQVATRTYRPGRQ